MPKFLTESGIYVPLDRHLFNLSGGKLAVPTTSGNLSDVEIRSIGGDNTALSGELIFSFGSGVLMIASGALWVGVTL